MFNLLQILLNFLASSIVSGLPRTGTMSTFTALEALLPGRCHHMVRAFEGQLYCTVLYCTVLY